MDNDFNVRDCIMLAGEFESLRADAGSSVQRLTPRTPGAIVISADLAARIKPDVEQMRQELFGKTCAPFTSYDEAVTWIEETASSFRKI